MRSIHLSVLLQFLKKQLKIFMSSTEGLSKMLSLVPSVQDFRINVGVIRYKRFSESGRGFMVNGIPGMQAHDTSIQ